MPQPNDALVFPLGIQLLYGGYCPSDSLIDLLVNSRSNYTWPLHTTAALSQQKILDLILSVSNNLRNLNSSTAHSIIVDVSEWAGNNANSHQIIVNANIAQQTAMQTALTHIVGGRFQAGVDALSRLDGISLVIASKILRFCSPNLGAAVDRHASYFFNSLPVIGHGMSTHFSREWSSGRHTASRLAIYSAGGYVRNRDEYFNTYLPVLLCIATELNNANRQYICAATENACNWTPADVEMASYYWWACNGAR